MSSVPLPPIHVTGRHGWFRNARLENGTRLFLGVPGEVREATGGRIPFLEFEQPVALVPLEPSLWAAFAGSAYGQEISLHASRREALEACVNALGLDREEREIGTGDDYDEDDLVDALDNYCGCRADDWHVNEVALP